VRKRSSKGRENHLLPRQRRKSRRGSKESRHPEERGGYSKGGHARYISREFRLAPQDPISSQLAPWSTRRTLQNEGAPKWRGVLAWWTKEEPLGAATGESAITWVKVRLGRGLTVRDMANGAMKKEGKRDTNRKGPTIVYWNHKAMEDKARNRGKRCAKITDFKEKKIAVRPKRRRNEAGSA